MVQPALKNKSCLLEHYNQGLRRLKFTLRHLSAYWWHCHQQNRKPSSASFVNGHLHNVTDGVAPNHCFATEMTTGMSWPNSGWSHH